MKRPSRPTKISERISKWRERRGREIPHRALRALRREVSGCDEPAPGLRRRNIQTGSFLPDAKYRLAVCKYAASLYDEVIADCQAWEKQFPSNPQLGEVLALLGDAYAASDRESAAIRFTSAAYQTATTDEVLNYSLFAASKLLQKQSAMGQSRRAFQRLRQGQTG